MSNAIFPSFPGRAIGLDRAPYFSTNVQTDGSGVEYTSAWQGTPRCRYTFKLIRLSQDVAAVAVAGSYANGDELSTLKSFHAAHLGRFDSFLFVDPDTGAQVRCRFDSDDLSVRRVTSRIWEADISLVSVK